ncbi:hypothetical protein [Clostridium butyricum]|uniref:hypothetical protein n=1 Tax=Clostridium butyricum TaxID=1492 RepID=UPI00374EDC92
MDIWDSVGIASTVISIGGAYKSWHYYKRSKDVTIYGNTQIALVESEKIINYLNEMMKLSNGKLMKKGVATLFKQVCSYGEEIKKSLDEIRKVMPTKDFKDIEKLLDSQEIEIVKYVSTFIQGTIIVDEKLVIDDNFHLCMKRFSEMHILIKEKLEAQGEKLK